MQNHHSHFIFLVICMVATIPSICSDIFVPSIPAISESFNVSVDQIQLTISTLMCSFAFSQLFYGPMSQAYGRKKLLVLGISLIALGTLICSQAQSIRVLTFGHIIEGFGLGACSLFRAILRDCYDGQELRQKSNYANLLMTLFYPAAPMIGGFCKCLMAGVPIFSFCFSSPFPAYSCSYFSPKPITTAIMNK
jgi:MFS family permease